VGRAVEDGGLRFTVLTRSFEPEAFDAKNGKAGARRRRRRAGGADRSARGPDILREEREALQRIRTAIEAWDKYEIVDRPGRAEMLIAIRKGRHGSVGGVSFSSPDDMLEEEQDDSTVPYDDPDESIVPFDDPEDYED